MPAMRLIKKQGSRIDIRDRAYVLFNSFERGVFVCKMNKSDCGECELFDACVGDLKRVHVALRHRGLNRDNFVRMMNAVRFYHYQGMYLFDLRVVYDGVAGQWVIKVDMLGVSEVY